MKKNRNVLLTILICLGFLVGIPNVFAEEISDVSEIDLSELIIGSEFTVDNDNYTYKVTEINTDEIYFHERKDNNRISDDIYHFEVDVYENGSSEVYTSRKFVRLRELCSLDYIKDSNGKKLNLCEATNYTSKKNNLTIKISRQYANTISDTIKNVDTDPITYEEINREVYYVTEHKLGTNEFESVLYLSGNDGFDLKEFDCSDEDEICYSFGGSEAKSDRLSKTGILTGDVETLVDSKNNIYVSLRFLSEALGARVDWLENAVEQGIDAVLIRFYDNDNYCKEYDVNFTENNEDFEGMYKEFINALRGSKSISFDLKYTFWDGENTDTQRVKWNQLFVGGYAAKQGYVFWNKDLKKVDFESAASQSQETQSSDFQKICPNENYDSNNQIKSFDGCIEITGIIRYYGVPIPINLLREDNDKCDFIDDNGGFENSDNNYNNDDDDSDSKYEYDDIIYALGDIHIDNISDLDIANDYDINFTYQNRLDKFDDELEEVIDNLEEDKNYKIVLFTGNNAIHEIINTADDIKNELKDLAEEYAKIYDNFYDDVKNDNVEIYIIGNTPLGNDAGEFVEYYWDYLKDELYDRGINKSKVNFFEFDDVDFDYNDDKGLKYTENTYEEMFEEFMDYLTSK